MGYVLQRGQLCFHSMFAEAWSCRGLLRGWLLGVAIAPVGLSLLPETPRSRGLEHWATGCAGIPLGPWARHRGWAGRGEQLQVRAVLQAWLGHAGRTRHAALLESW